MLGSSQSVGPYRFIRHIGSGAFAEVYLVERENRQYALKVIEIALGKDPHIIDHEVRINAELKNIQSVCQICDYFRDENNYYLVFEYCQKGDLKKYNQIRKKMTEVVAKPIIQNILKAVDSIHSRKICHRDIKPENIFMTSTNKIKFGDFGLATIFSEENGCLVRGSVGSPQYASPECLSMKYYNGRATDVWSLGVVFYEMLVGKIPWKSTNKDDLFNEIKNDNVTFSEEMGLSQACIDFLRRFLEIDVQKRFTIDEALNHIWLAVKISNRMSMDFSQIQMSFKLEPPTYITSNNNENAPFSEKAHDNCFNSHHHNQNSLYMSDNMNIRNNINFINNELDFKNFGINGSCSDSACNDDSITSSTKSVNNENNDNKDTKDNKDSSDKSNDSNDTNNLYETDAEINYNILHAEMNKSRKTPRRCSNYNEDKVFSKQFNFKLDLNFAKNLTDDNSDNNNDDKNIDDNDTNRRTKDRSQSARITSNWRNRLFVNKSDVNRKNEEETNDFDSVEAEPRAKRDKDAKDVQDEDGGLKKKRRLTARTNRLGSVGNLATNIDMGSVGDAVKTVGGGLTGSLSPRNNNDSLDNQVNSIMEKIKKMRRA